MKVEMKDLRDHPVDLEVDCSPESLDLEDPEYTFPDQVKGAVLFTLGGERVIAQGRLETTVESSCVRCLKQVRTPLRAPVDVVYEQHKEPITPEEELFGPKEETDERVALFHGETIRPEQQFREAILIELPALPVCDAACKGLCPNCGADLNEGPCDCGAGNDDEPSWKSALKNMKLD